MGIVHFVWKSGMVSSARVLVWVGGVSAPARASAKQHLLRKQRAAAPTPRGVTRATNAPRKQAMFPISNLQAFIPIITFNHIQSVRKDFIKSAFKKSKDFTFALLTKRYFDGSNNLIICILVHISEVNSKELIHAGR